jgi:hypothetical protein
MRTSNVFHDCSRYHRLACEADCFMELPVISYLVASRKWTPIDHFTPIHLLPCCKQKVDTNRSLHPHTSINSSVSLNQLYPQTNLRIQHVQGNWKSRHSSRSSRINRDKTCYPSTDSEHLGWPDLPGFTRESNHVTAFVLGVDTAQDIS